MLTYHLDMSNQEGIKIFKEVENLGTEFSVKTSFITPEITYADENTIRKYISEERFKGYKRDINDILEKKKHVLSKEEGGRHTPFFTNYRPQFYFRTTDVTGVVTLPEGTEMVMPGDNVKMHVELIAPIALEEGTKFSIREGGRTVGAGIVTKIDK